MFKRPSIFRGACTRTLACALCAVAFSAHATPAAELVFRDLYVEALSLEHAQAMSGLFQLRVGRLTGSAETYLVTRGAGNYQNAEAGADSSDGSVFLGVGLDLPRLLPGFRPLLQVGASMNSNDANDPARFDFRLGEMSYHETSVFVPSLVAELYTEALYLHRARIFVASSRTGLFYRAFEFQGALRGALGPVLQTRLSTDSRAVEGNRFAQIETGARISLSRPLSLSLLAYSVWGVHSFERPSSFHDFRFLLSTGFAF